MELSLKSSGSIMFYPSSEFIWFVALSRVFFKDHSLSEYGNIYHEFTFDYVTKTLF